MMVEVRWLGRGGQGVVTASRLLGEAALLDGKYAQAFPEFGPERTGAPVLGFTRISDEPIEIHSQIYDPDAIVVIDPGLAKSPDAAKGLKRGGRLILNLTEDPAKVKEEMGLKGARLYALDAKRLSMEVIGRPIYNTTMLGALLKVTGWVSVESAKKVVRERFPGEIGEKNVELMMRARDEVREYWAL